MQTDSPKADPPKRKRRWFQFSLRSLLIFTTICAIPCALLGRRIERKRHEREAVDVIVRSGGFAQYDWAREDDCGRLEWNSEPPGPEWLRELLGENFFSEVIALNIKGIPAGRLESIEALTELRSLRFWQFDVTDEDLTHLQGLSQLQDLDLVRTSVTDAGMKNLKGLTNLKHLNLCGTSITDAGLADLKQLSQLESLALLVTNVTDKGVNDLRKALPNCVIGYCGSTIPRAEMERYWEENPSLRSAAAAR